MSSQGNKAPFPLCHQSSLSTNFLLESLFPQCWAAYCRHVNSVPVLPEVHLVPLICLLTTLTALCSPPSSKPGSSDFVSVCMAGLIALSCNVFIYLPDASARLGTLWGWIQCLFDFWLPVAPVWQVEGVKLNLIAKTLKNSALSVSCCFCWIIFLSANCKNWNYWAKRQRCVSMLAIMLSQR